MRLQKLWRHTGFGISGFQKLVATILKTPAFLRHVLILQLLHQMHKLMRIKCRKNWKERKRRKLLFDWKLFSKKLFSWTNLSLKSHSATQTLNINYIFKKKRLRLGSDWGIFFIVLDVLSIQTNILNESLSIILSLE